MEKYLRPERFDANLNSPTASKEWKYWLRTLQNFPDSLNSNDSNTGNIDKLNLLINLVSPAVYKYIADCKTYDEAISKLNELYINPSNEIFACHKLATRKQNPGESIDEFLQSLCNLAKDCNFKAVKAESYCEESIRAAFISGLSSNLIRQRLLEGGSLTLKTTYHRDRI